jgi:hypothetical protein
MALDARKEELYMQVRHVVWFVLGGACRRLTACCVSGWLGSILRNAMQCSILGTYSS